MMGGGVDLYMILILPRLYVYGICKQGRSKIVRCMAYTSRGGREGARFGRGGVYGVQSPCSSVVIVWAVQGGG